MIILILIVLGLLTVSIIFLPEFLVAVMQLTVIGVVCYIITTTFMKKEIGYLIFILYIFAVVGMGAQYIGPKVDHIKDTFNTLKSVNQKVDRYAK